jgi:hypothetical protein
MTESSNQGKVVGGLAILALGAGILVYVSQQESPDENTANFGCTLTTAGVGALAIGLSRGESSSAVVAQLGAPAAAGFACKQLVDSLVEDPGEPVTVNVQPGVGTNPIPQRITLDDLTSTVPPGSISRMLECADYTIPVLFQMCSDGQLAPPA